MYKSTHSLLLAGVNRRSFLKSSAALGLGAVASPAIVSNALSSSGELSIINWDDELPDPVIPDFEKTDGHQGHLDPVLAERGADQQAAGDRRRRLRHLPADA